MQKYDFIHKLPFPTGIFTFEGEPIDCNEAMIISSGAKDKATFMQLTCPQRLLDEGRHSRMLEEVINSEKGKSIRTLQRKLNKEKTVVSSCCRIQVFSLEERTFIVQNKGNDESNEILFERFDFILKEIKKLNPYLNKEGRNLLETLLENNNQIEQYKEGSLFVIERAKYLNLREFKLSQKESYICVLISMKFSNFDISYLSGFTAGSIRVNTHRICKKMGCTTKEELMNYFERFEVDNSSNNIEHKNQPVF